MYSFIKPTCKKCNSKSTDLSKVSPICRGKTTYETGLNNPYHYFGSINKSEICCIIL